MALIDAATATGQGLPAAVLQITTGDTRLLAFSFAQVVSTASGDAPSGATCELTDIQTGRSVRAAISTAPTLATATWSVTQSVLGSALEGGHSYYLYAGLSANSNDKYWTRLKIEVAKR